MDIEKVYGKALFRYNKKSQFVLEESLSFEEGVLTGKFTCHQLYLKEGEKSSAMNNTDFMMLSNQVCYLIIYLYLMDKFGLTLDELVGMHGNIAIYEQNFSFKKTVDINDENEFKAEIHNVRKNRFEVTVQINGGNYITAIKLVVMRRNIHF